MHGGRRGGSKRGEERRGEAGERSLGGDRSLMRERGISCGGEGDISSMVGPSHIEETQSVFMARWLLIGGEMESGI